MSVPHTGKLTAEVAGHPCQFNGDLWTCPADPALAAHLNAALELCPTQHYGIRSLALNCLRVADLEAVARNIEGQGDAWDDELAEDEID